MLQFSRIHLSGEADNRLKILRGRTGLQANFICRLAFCVSLREPSPPDERSFADENGREMHRATLFGSWDEVFYRLLTERLHDYGQAAEEADHQLVGHVNRGIALLTQSVRSLSDLAAALIEEVG